MNRRDFLLSCLATALPWPEARTPTPGTSEEAHGDVAADGQTITFVEGSDLGLRSPGCIQAWGSEVVGAATLVAWDVMNCGGFAFAFAPPFPSPSDFAIVAVDARELGAVRHSALNQPSTPLSVALVVGDGRRCKEAVGALADRGYFAAAVRPCPRTGPLRALRAAIMGLLLPLSQRRQLIAWDHADFVTFFQPGTRALATFYPADADGETRCLQAAPADARTYACRMAGPDLSLSWLEREIGTLTLNNSETVNETKVSSALIRNLPHGRSFHGMVVIHPA